MIAFAASNNIGSPWTHMEPIRLGSVPPSLPTADIFVCVERDGAPWKRFDLYSDYQSAFFDAQLWNGMIVIGAGSEVHCVDWITDRIQTYELGSYFGQLYPYSELLLVASAEKLFCFDAAGGLTWTTPDLGIDGVLVHRIDCDVVIGEGEWDPPGGWREFRVDLTTGTRID